MSCLFVYTLEYIIAESVIIQSFPVHQHQLDKISTDYHIVTYHHQNHRHMRMAVMLQETTEETYHCHTTAENVHMRIQNYL